MMVKLSERITPDDFKKELSVGWTLAPFPELSAQSTSDEKAESDGDAQSLASACFSSDVETIFNAQMTATRIQVWKWAVVCSGVTFVGVGLAKLIFPELNLTGQPSTVYDSDAVGPYGLFQLGIALAIQFFKDFLLNYHNAVWYTNEFLILLFICQNTWVNYRYYYTIDAGPTMGQVTRNLGFSCLMPPIIAFLMGTRFSILLCVTCNLMITCNSAHSGYANNFWTFQGHVLILSLTYFICGARRQSFIKNLKLHCTAARLLIFQNLERIGLKNKFELDSAEKMRAYQKIVAATAHDLRTASSALLSGCSVLTTLSNFAQVRGEERKKELSVIANMSAMAKYCSQFLEGMTLSSRLLDGSAVPINLGSIDVRELLEESIAVARLACSGSDSVDHGSTLPQGLSAHIYSDSLCLSRNLLNFLSNASKHTRKGSITVNVTLRYPTLDDRNEKPIMIEFAVTDTGKKIPEEVKSTLFEPFVSHDGSTGLGLFVVKIQSAALGGSCGVRDNPTTNGSEFYFSIPYVTSEEQLNAYRERLDSHKSNNVTTHVGDNLNPGAKKVFVEEDVGEADKKRESSSRPGDIRGRTILLIDDTSSLLNVVCEELTNVGYVVTKGHGAHEGLELMKAHKYGLVLVDIKMPNQNGDEVVAGFRHWEKFNRSKEHLQTIYALTAYTNDEVLCRCHEAGMSGVIRKPLQVLMLADLTRHVASDTVWLAPLAASAIEPAADLEQRRRAH